MQARNGRAGRHMATNRFVGFMWVCVSICIQGVSKEMPKKSVFLQKTACGFGLVTVKAPSPAALRRTTGR
ncbi:MULTISPECIES: hypothetical protein, partial [unclassified Mameliella]|uniref:hypothetical protein n=1 Tax=unclassified Mameliella TaxID=2630630 RepID=UPI00273D3730